MYRTLGPAQVLIVSRSPLVVSVTRFAFANGNDPFANGEPRVRILLPPAESHVRT
jgi:hypothetical protein